MARLTNEIERIKNLQNMDLSDSNTRQEIFSLLETLLGIIIELQQENQELKDEINRLKGEQGKPNIKPKKPTVDVTAKKGQLDTGTKKPWVKGSKNDKVQIDRVETIHLDTTALPPDVEFKGYEEKLVQNILIKTDNVLYKLEKYYSSSERKTYIAEVDESIRSTEFGAETKALISCLYYENRVTENKIASFLNANGLSISEGTISNILIKDQSKVLTKIKQEILEAGLRSSVYQQIDDTGMKIAGQNAYATIVCNEKYSAFFINTSKSRETVKSFLTAFLASLFIVLVGDDAPQFKKIAKLFALCWVHEERHYKKLVPVLDCHRAELDRVRGQIWVYYEKLKKYKAHPTEQKKSELWVEFDDIFGQEIGYDALNKRLSLTMEKKAELLVVLDYPQVPLHNNLSENGVREIVMKRKISGGVETSDGVKAWENNMSILGTCRKLRVSFYDFMIGVFSKKMIIDLPGLIQ